MPTTVTNSEAVEFFEENYQAVQNYGMSILASRSDRVLYRQGRDLLNQAVSVKRQNTRYSDKELLLALTLYNQGLGRLELIETFNKTLTHSHTDASLNRLCGQIECLDPSHPMSDKHIVSNRLTELANQTNPEWF